MVDITKLHSIPKIKVVSSYLEQVVEANPLSLLQRIVCSIFKITAKKSYWVDVVATVEDVELLRTRDVVVSEMLNRFVVVNIDKVTKKILLKNVSPIDQHSFSLKGNIAKIYSVFIEG